MSHELIIDFKNTETAYKAYSDKELRKASRIYRLLGNSFLSGLGKRMAELAHSIGFPIKPFAWPIYSHFCSGETLKKSEPVFRKLSQHGMKVMINYGVEAEEDDDAFDAAMEENLRAIEFAATNGSVQIVCAKPTGIGRFALFEKLQDGDTLTPEEQAEFERVKARMDKLCRAAEERGIVIFWDAEESWIQDMLDALVLEMMARYNRKEVIVFNTFQMYRHDRLSYLAKCVEQAASEGWIMGAKLVRGAYMEKERARAVKFGYPSPIQPDKAATDRDFDSGVTYCLDHLGKVALSMASHSEASCQHLAHAVLERGIAPNHPHICTSQLYGMGDHLSFNLSDYGFNAYKYIPYGPVNDVIPYLIRRADENSAVAHQLTGELSLIQLELKRRSEAK